MESECCYVKTNMVGMLFMLIIYEVEMRALLSLNVWLVTGNRKRLSLVKVDGPFMFYSIIIIIESVMKI